jgi:hypothetical protein
VELLAETGELFAEARETARDGNFVEEENDPDDHPGGEKIVEVFHQNSSGSRFDSNTPNPSGLKT